MMYRIIKDAAVAVTNKVSDTIGNLLVNHFMKPTQEESDQRQAGKVLKLTPVLNMILKMTMSFTELTMMKDMYPKMNSLLKSMEMYERSVERRQPRILRKIKRQFNPIVEFALKNLTLRCSYH
ncbi:hypothetical protein BC833DRAFT_150702 [Globomyces pollinis-pini]|nr:hypothetical protein BC833DRAFT_150702 [Globomyces pollinis-pini]